MRFISLLVACVLAAAALLGTAAAAAAHDVHTVGRVTIALGWQHEPAYIGVENAVQVIARDASGNGITTITDKDLVVDITAAGSTLHGQTLVPTADPDSGRGMPGEYRAPIIPTVAGPYTFHLHGTVTGQAIDETVTSSDTTFDLVTDPRGAEFPVQIASQGDLATHATRLDARVSAAQSRADSAMTVATVAAVVAVVATLLVIAGGVTTMRRRRR